MPIHPVNLQWTNHDSWVLAHKGVSLQSHLPNSCLVMWLYVLLKTVLQGGRVLESTSPLLVKNNPCRRTFTLVVFDEDAYIYNYTRQVNACRVSCTSCIISHDLPRLMNMSMACLSFFSCFSGPVLSRSENELTESQAVKEWNPINACDNLSP